MGVPRLLGASTRGPMPAASLSSWNFELLQNIHLFSNIGSPSKALEHWMRMFYLLNLTLHTRSALLMAIQVLFAYWKGYIHKLETNFKVYGVAINQDTLLGWVMAIACRRNSSKSPRKVLLGLRVYQNAILDFLKKVYPRKVNVRSQKLSLLCHTLKTFHIHGKSAISEAFHLSLKDLPSQVAPHSLGPSLLNHGLQTRFFSPPPQ
ncbi:hypothetical protein Cni_G29399 [Canna indica]|uniref:Uncharacterized protein n=1 Tax=Canna indica TaxID=4628 RepID=A0AAQ3QR84_9LILI|nr:hypothetical protein Cni_G29399 [Canna indica]